MAADICASIPVAMERLHGWIMVAIEALIGDNRVAKCKPDIIKMARAMITGDCSFEAVVVLFGGTTSSNKRYHNAASSAAGTGRAGDFSGVNAATDLPKAFEAFGKLLRRVQGTALGGTMGTELDYGFRELVDEGLESVDVPRVRLLIEKIFERLSLWCERRRQRVGHGAPDIGALVSEVRTESLAALTNEQASSEVALKVALAAIAGWSGGTAGAKERATAAAKRAAAGGEPDPATGRDEPAKDADGLTSAQRKRARAKLKKKEAADGKAAGAGAGGQTTPGQPATAGNTKTPPQQTPGQPQPQTPQGQTQPQQAGGPWGTQIKVHRPIAAPVPTFKPNSILRFVDVVTKEGAVEAFDHLTNVAYPNVPGAERPCAFACLGKCDKAKTGGCYKCDARSKLTAPVDAPAGAVAKVKAACDSVTAAKITGG
jgi:hypothetical protein